MKYTLYEKNRIIVVKPEMGRLDYEVAPDFRKQVVDLLSEHVDWALVLDFSSVEYLDSSGLGSLIVLARGNGERKIAIAGASGQVLHTLDIGRIGKIMVLLRNVSDYDQLQFADC